MIGFAALLNGLSPPTAEGQFHVRKVVGSASYYAARNSSGYPALLVEAASGGRSVPRRLAGIEVAFGTPCQVVEPGGTVRAETLTSVMCILADPGIEAYFASVAELLITILGPMPRPEEVLQGIDHLTTLFQKLRQPSRKAVSGLVGELIVILAASNTAAAIAAWRTDPDERYDFSFDRLRVEAKASANRKRQHILSLEQAEPPEGTVGLLASVLVEQAGGGCSLDSAVHMIEARLHDYGTIMRLRSVIADTLGSDLLLALKWRFDLQQALSSLLFFDLRQIPAMRGPLPVGVSGVRFTTDLTATFPVQQKDLLDIGGGIFST